MKKDDSKFTRRRFLRQAALTATATQIFTTEHRAAAPAAARVAASEKATVPAWPIFDEQDEQAVQGVVRSGKWGRQSGRKVLELEQAFRERAKAKYCLATASGTTALLTSFGVLGVGPGDEVILPPYTWVGCFNVVTASYSLPVFVDINPETFQIDARRIGAAITPATKVMMPVHMGGSPFDIDAILAVAREKKIPVIEDACQAPMAEWRGTVLGNFGQAGCISFQASKNLTAGEGGAIITNDEEFAEKCYNFHNQGNRRTPGSATGSGRAANYRMTELQGGLLISQLRRFEAQSRTRTENAEYLTSLLNQIPGVKPARLHDGCTRSAYHVYMMRVQSEHFAGMSRARLLQELGKAGLRSASGGYSALNRAPHVTALATNAHYVRLYGKSTMAKWAESNHCPENDRICAEAVWFPQDALLGERSSMERIADAFRKIQKNAGELVKA